jgi:hypothetical protein
MVQKRKIPVTKGRMTEVRCAIEFDMTLEILQARQALRLRVLRAIFYGAAANGTESVSLRARQLSLTEDEFRDSTLYLLDCGLVEPVDTNTQDELRLTSLGYFEVESTLSHPERQTEHFTPKVIDLVNHLTSSLD